MKLLNTMRFQTVMCSPFRCLIGLVQSLQAKLHTVAGEKGSANEAMTQSLHDHAQNLHDRAVKIIKQTLCTDAPFLFSPQQLALEALQAAIREPAGGAGAAKTSAAPDGSLEWLEWVGRQTYECPQKMEEHLAAVRRLREDAVDLSTMENLERYGLKTIDARATKVRKRVLAVVGKEEDAQRKLDQEAAEKKRLEKQARNAEGQRQLQQQLSQALGDQAAQQHAEARRLSEVRVPPKHARFASSLGLATAGRPAASRPIHLARSHPTVSNVCWCRAVL